MINQTELTKDWIRSVSGKNNADPILVEKVVRALLLLEGLVKQKLDFVFKGGTALMLHFESAKRLSIDIDIILSDREVDLEEIISPMAEEQGFTRWELQHRAARSGIEKAHYKFYFKPLQKTGKDEAYVLLDVLFEEVHYAALTELPIRSLFIPDTGRPLTVKVPSIDDLIGDKLTASAPNTTGIPYFKGNDSMSMEIIKQLYDVGNLFDKAESLRTIKTTFERFAEAELDGLTINDVLNDIFQTSLCIATRGKAGQGKFDELQNGITRIRNFIHSGKYQIDKAITHATKAAYLAALLQHNAEAIGRFNPAINMTEWLIEHPLSTRLNKLKKSNPEAFFYWYSIYLMSKS